MIRKLARQVAKQWFYWWMQREVTRYMRSIDSLSLKRKVEGKSVRNIDTDGLEEAQDFFRNLWNYGTFMAIHSYRIGDERTYSATIAEEARAAVKDMTQVFLRMMKEPENHPIAWSDMFPIPPYTFYAPDQEGVLEDVSAQVPQVHSLKQLLLNMGLEEALEFLSNDKESKQIFQDLIAQYTGGHNKTSWWRPSGLHYAGLVWHLLYQSVTDNDLFCKKYGIRFEGDGEVRCFYNVLNLYIHFIALNGKLQISKSDREVIFAASSLHPLQDDYLDNEGASPEAVKGIHSKLNGDVPGYTDEKIEQIYTMIDVIYKRYPPERHPQLKHIFTSLHEWQCISEAQKDDGISDEELLRISFMKGGYAFAFFGYVANGRMDTAQFRHFFTMGAIFQILDDFHDIKDDMETRATTVWTRAIKRKQPMEHVLSAVFGLQDYYDRSTPLIPSFRHPVVIRRIEQLGIRYDIYRFFSMNEELFSEAFISKFAECFPFRTLSSRKFFTITRQHEKLQTFKQILIQFGEILKGIK